MQRDIGLKYWRDVLAWVALTGGFCLLVAPLANDSMRIITGPQQGMNDQDAYLVEQERARPR